VSNAIRYDSLLVRELAAALHRAFASSRIDGVWFDRERLRFTLLTRPYRRGQPAPSLLWQLHPASGHLTHAPGEAAGARVPLASPTHVRSVHAPPDERVIVFELTAGDAAAAMPRRIIVELVTNHWNAVAVSGDGRVTAVLREREVRDRVLRPGAEYQPPRPSGRPGGREPLSLEAWVELLGTIPPGERMTALPRLAAWVSPQNAGWIIGDADVAAGREPLVGAWHRYRALVSGASLVPVLREEQGGRWQPYVAADGVPGEGAAGELLALFEEAADRAAATPVGGVTMEEALAAVARRMEAVQRRMDRLREEAAGGREESARLRGLADILLSQLHSVRRGMDTAALFDFQGNPVTVPLDPALSPADNAGRLYDTARRRERAADRIPELLSKAEGELAGLETLAGRIREGTADPAEVARVQRASPGSGRDAPPALPWREYRTSRGLEVRVGRGSKSNDELTFRNSSPNDIWLHARDVAGAHVILRWPHAEANPPPADITEAAVLAALHSRARTSGVVPVDWTRRKHVRKPRKAPPGLVIPERVKTVFVEPDPALEERLRQP
jgi:hypothetical protein